jgi:AraC family L-rhamnose operon regulatory protein RhaS
MDLFVKSHDKDWNRIVFLKVLEGKEAVSVLNDRETCKIVLILNGNGMIKCNNNLLYVMAPALLCLNHEDTISSEDFNAFHMRVLFFKPIALNDHLSYEIFNVKYYNEMAGTTNFQDLSLLSSFYGINCMKRTLILLEASSSIVLNNLIEKVKMELEEQKDGYWPCRSRSYFIELLFFIDGAKTEGNMETICVINEKNTNKLTYDIIQYLNQNINKKITLNMLEKKFACNRNLINNEFQREMNTTVMKYFVWMRMQLAGAILRDTEIPLTEVALRVGYSDAGYFSRAIKLHFGKTPSDYRNYSTISPLL